MSDTRQRPDHGRNRWRDKGKPRPYRTDPTCRVKRRFTDEAAARAHAMLSIQEEKNRWRLWVYPCRHCGGWHLTSKENGKRYLVTAHEPVHEPA
jgi:hypothetical protein